jgi:homoserine kinase type II
MRDIAATAVATTIRKRFRLEPLEVERLYEGFDTRNWVISTSAGTRWFVKQYPSSSKREDQLEALCVSVGMHEAGIPTPRVLRTYDGQLVGEHDGTAVAVFEFIEDARPSRSMNLAQMHAAGALLGRIHTELRRWPTLRPSETERWLEFDIDKKRRELGSYLEIIAEKVNPDAFDIASRPLILERLRVVGEMDALRGRLAGLTSQPLHHDYGRPNILFSSDDLRAVLDFCAPAPFLISYELGRIAFQPENFRSADWLGRAMSLIRGYISTCDIDRRDFLFSPDAWLLQLLRSTYGLKQHYTRPLELQAELDDYWFHRAHASIMLLFDLDEIHSRLERL